MHLPLEILLLVCFLCLGLTKTEETTRYCRERNGYSFPPDVFLYRACSMCYLYLFHNLDKPKPVVVAGSFGAGLRILDANLTIPGFTGVVYPDPSNSTTLDIVCKTLNADECSRWTSCCEHGVKCCEDQLDSPQSGETNGCQHTWDGYSCWEQGIPGVTSIQKCPSFLPLSVSSSELSKYTHGSTKLDIRMWSCRPIIA